MPKISVLAEDLFASYEGFCTMELGMFSISESDITGLTPVCRCSGHRTIQAVYV
jgi:hypothetical protein